MRFATVSVIALLLGVTPALASNQRASAGPMMPQLDFATADANSDGVVTREEWQAYVTDIAQTHRGAMFEQRADALIEAGDANGDGMLDRAELIAAMGAQHEAFRGTMAERHEQRAEQRTERRTERTERRAERRAERRGEDRAGRGFHRHGQGHGGGMGGGAGMMTPGDFAERSFSRIDADNDGQISAEEFAAAQAWWTDRGQRRRQGTSD